MVLPGPAGGCFGYLAFRSRIRGVYFSDPHAGADLRGVPAVLPQQPAARRQQRLHRFQIHPRPRPPRRPRNARLFIASGVALLLVYLFCKWLTTTKFGKVQRAIRDSENRVMFSGYSTANFKLFIFVLAALIASLAGVLYVPQVGIINPSEMATGQIARSRRLGRRRRTRHAHRADHRRVRRQRHEKLGHARVSRSLADFSRRACSSS